MSNHNLFIHGADGAAQPATTEQIHDPFLAGVKVDPLLDPIRNEPQFKALLARMRFPP